MTRWARRLLLAVVATLALELQGCGRSPAAPSARGQANTPEGPSITGRVTDGTGSGVAQARILVLSGANESREAVSDANGFYTLTGDPARGVYSGNVTRPGFEPSPLSVHFQPGVSSHPRFNVRLYEIVRISAGETIEQTVRADDPTCDYTVSHVDYGPCRRIRVVSPARGRLTVWATVSASESPYPDIQPWLQLPHPPFYVGDPFEVVAGSETIVEIIAPWATTTFALRTALEPR